MRAKFAVYGHWVEHDLVGEVRYREFTRSARRLRATSWRAIAVDGTTLRGTCDQTGHSVHLLATMDHTSGIVLAQREVDGKTNEITVFGPPLSGMDLAGVVVTADAMHTQRAHARHLVEDLGADFVLCVKDNQPTLFAQLDALPWTSTPAHTTTDMGHGVRADTHPVSWRACVPSRSARRAWPVAPPSRPRRDGGARDFTRPADIAGNPCLTSINNFAETAASPARLGNLADSLAHPSCAPGIARHRGSHVTALWLHSSAH